MLKVETRLRMYEDYRIDCPVCRATVIVQAHPHGDRCPRCRNVLTEREVYTSAFAGQLVWTSGRALVPDLSHIHK